MALSISRAVNTFSRKAIQILGKDCKTVPTLTHKLQARPLSNLFNFSKCNSVLLERYGFLASQQSKYANLHTEADRRFAELLGDEIQEEKKRSDDLPKMSDGWKVSFRGAEGKLTKTHDGDNIEVSFSLNGSLPPIAMDDQEVEEAGDDKPIVSYPEFSVKVVKSGSDKAVEFECYFPEDVQEGMSDDSLSPFSIRNVAIYQGEISESTYIMETENLDQDVYSYFLTFLADRSVDQQFADELVELTTAAEQREYISTLEDLMKFVSSK